MKIVALAPHPRLLATDEDFAGLPQRLRNDPLLAEVWKRVLARADLAQDEPVVRHELIGPRLLPQSRAALARIIACSLVFRVTGETRHRDRAVRELLAAVALPDWNPSHALDTAELAFAVALGYDWLHGTLNADEARAISGGLARHVIPLAPPPLGVSGAGGGRPPFTVRNDNWNQVCHGGLVAAALAFGNDSPDLLQTVRASLDESLPRALTAYEPDGAFPEGPAYWDYGTTYYVLILAMLRSALGETATRFCPPSFVSTASYRLAIRAPDGGDWNYADTLAERIVAPALGWLTQHVGSVATRAEMRRQLAESLRADQNHADLHERFFPLHALWLPPPQPAEPESFPRLTHFRGGAELAVLRSPPEDERSVYLGLKAGLNSVGHAHLDLGSFFLVAGGVRWTEELGRDNYNLPGYWEAAPGGRRWSYPRLNNLTHCTLTPQGAVQDVAARAVLRPIPTNDGRSPSRVISHRSIPNLCVDGSEQWYSRRMEPSS